MSMTVALLGEIYSGPDGAKRLARDADRSVHAAYKWLAGVRSPGADVLLRIAQAPSKEAAEIRARIVGLLEVADAELAAWDARKNTAAKGRENGQASSGADSSGSGFRPRNGSDRDAHLGDVERRVGERRRS